MKRYLLALLGFFFVATSQAETIPANTSTSTPAVQVWGHENWMTYTTQEAYCLSNGNRPVNVAGGVATSFTLVASGQCGSPSTGYATSYTRLHCFSGSNGPNGTCVTSGYSCPSGQGWTLNGSTCTRPDCTGGQERQPNGTCSCANGAQTGNDGTCCPVSGSGGGAPMQWCYVDSPAASTCDSAGTNGCKVRCNNVTFQKGTSGDQVQIWPKNALGQNCSYTGTKANTNTGGGPLNDAELKDVTEATKDPAKAKSPESCLAAGMGYVTGSSGTNCVPGGDTGVTKKESSSSTNTDGSGTTSESTTKETSQTPTGGEQKETTTKTNPDGSTTTTTKTTTCAEDGTCKTVTTETSKDASGNTTGTKSGTDNKSTSEFCKANPDSELCKGATDSCKDHPERMGCMEHGEAPQVPALTETEKGISSIIAVNVASNASCPADIQLPKGMSFSFGPFCDYASAFRPIILVLAWITAGFLVFGYRGNN